MPTRALRTLLVFVAALAALGLAVAVPVVAAVATGSQAGDSITAVRHETPPVAVRGEALSLAEQVAKGVAKATLGALALLVTLVAAVPVVVFGRRRPRGSAPGVELRRHAITLRAPPAFLSAF
ncbi:MAG: hypothetical protein ACT4PW_04600 [Acidimicrobiia bacterium]